MLYKYVESLKDGLCDPSTISNHLWAINKYITYIRDFQDMKVSKKILNGIRVISKGLRKERKVKERSLSTSDAHTKSKAWPNGGITELQNILKRWCVFNLCIDSLDRIEPTMIRLCSQTMEGGILPSSSYNRFLEFIVSHLYIFNPQARIGAIKELTLEDFDQLKMTGIISCEMFKTSETYHFQHVTTCPATIEYLERYVKYFRPPNETKYLFVSSNGKKMDNLGR
jgi:hypothetical protein